MRKMIFVLILAIAGCGGCEQQTVDTEFDGGTVTAGFDDNLFEAEGQAAFEVGPVGFWLGFSVAVDVAVPTAQFGIVLHLAMYDFFTVEVELACEFDPDPYCVVCVGLNKPETPNLCLHFGQGIDFEIRVKPSTVGTAETSY